MVMRATVSAAAANERYPSGLLSGRLRKNPAPQEQGNRHMTIVVLVLTVAVFAGVSSSAARLGSSSVIHVHWWGLALVALALQSLPVEVGSAERTGVAAASLVASYVI